MLHRRNSLYGFDHTNLRISARTIMTGIFREVELGQYTKTMHGCGYAARGMLLISPGFPGGTQEVFQDYGGVFPSYICTPFP